MLTRRALSMIPFATLLSPLLDKRKRSQTPWEVTANRVRVREAPATDSPVIAVLSRGDLVYRTGELELVSDVFWAEVKLPSDEVGWIREDQIRIYFPEATPFPTLPPSGAGGDEGMAWFARQLDTTGCEDGVTTSITLAKSEEAGVKGESDSYWRAHEACGKEGDESAILTATCTQAQDFAGDGKRLVLCLLIVANRRAYGSVALDTDDVALVTPKMAILPQTRQYDDWIMPEARFPGGISVPPGEANGVLIVFEADEDDDPQGGVLMWYRRDADRLGTGDDQTRQVILDDLDTDLRLFPPDPAATPVPSGAESGGAADGDSLIYNGGSDEVIGPIEITAGVYRVSAEYDGESNFIVRAITDDGDETLLFNEIGSYSGEATLQIAANTRVILDVSGVGWWSLEVEPLM